jgi:hypothetical protein
MRGTQLSPGATRRPLLVSCSCFSASAGTRYTKPPDFSEGFAYTVRSLISRSATSLQGDGTASILPELHPRKRSPPCVALPRRSAELPDGHW